MLSDIDHGRGPFATKHHQDRRQFRVQTQSDAIPNTVDQYGIVEPRIQNHARSAEHMVRSMAGVQSLAACALGAADQILRLTFDPEVGRIVGHIGQDRDQRDLRHDPLDRVKKGAIEVRYHRHHNIGLLSLGLLPLPVSG